MSLNVSTQNVEKVIRSVLQHIAGINVENLPIAKLNTLIQMTSEMKGHACQQLAEQLSRAKDLTLHNHLSKNKKKLSIEEVCSNLHKLFLPPSSVDQEGLIGRRIKHRWIVDGEE